MVTLLPTGSMRPAIVKPEGAPSPPMRHAPLMPHCGRPPSVPRHVVRRDGSYVISTLLPARSVPVTVSLKAASKLILAIVSTAFCDAADDSSSEEARSRLQPNRDVARRRER